VVSRLTINPLHYHPSLVLLHSWARHAVSHQRNVRRYCYAALGLNHCLSAPMNANGVALGWSRGKVETSIGTLRSFFTAADPPANLEATSPRRGDDGIAAVALFASFLDEKYHNPPASSH